MLDLTRFFALAIFSAICLPREKAQAEIQPGKLTCEYLENPLGIEAKNPGLSWTVVSSERNQMQTAYEVLVSDKLSELEVSKAKIWESGKVQTANSLHITYHGKALQPFTRYYWRVRIYDQHGKASAWSKPAWFETAMTRETDWQAKWIGDGSKQRERDEDFYKEDAMPLFRKNFKAGKRVSSARLYISGLGYYEAYFNGKKVGDHILDPGWTTFEKQVLYTVYDVSDLIRQGDNTAGIMLGNGWYNPLPLRFFGKFNLRDVLKNGRPCVKAQILIQYGDGTREWINTDESWDTAPGPVVLNNVYLGEHYDARLEKTGWNVAGKASGSWKKAVSVQGPAGTLTVQMQPPVRVTKIVRPVRITKPKPGTFIFDMGQNFAGIARIKVKGESGRKITLRYGEELNPDGSLNVLTTVAGQIKQKGIGGPGAPEVAWQEDSYTLKGSGVEVWSPRFTFHGFRYVEVSGWPGEPALNALEGLRLSADLPESGDFSCSNEMFNKVNEMSKWTFLSNVFSVQSDCAAREKFGYGGDIVGTAESFIYSYDMANFYRKAVHDFANDQREEGGLTETAPYIGIADRGQGDGTGPLGWQLAYPYLMKQLYDFYGDKRILEENYAQFQKQIEFLRKKADSHLFYRDISDHESLDTKPEALTASSFYHHHLKLMGEFAGVLGKSDDSLKYSRLADRVEKAILEKFYVPKTGRFDNATQAAQIFGLWYDFPPVGEKKAAFEILEREFDRKDGHLATGIFSTKMMFDVLRNENRNDLAYSIANKRDFPGWGYMVEKGATTIWETWAYSDGVFSQNHPMFGSVIEWFYRSLLGINALKPGFERVQIKPQPAGDLTWAKGSYNSIRGSIGSNWRIEQYQFRLDVSIPANTVAEVWLPSMDTSHIQEGGRPIADVAGIRWLRAENGASVYAVGSGHYSFTTSWH
ncbi:family 78 glycoside hydrolase catalytic domain [Dyadobacter sp. LHD-138]|uniref:family 78 glycoside hydrolase catalytic domain n=1 Tax=Dyadobacter sp. LHD-138 TaxID=3071413 RepID=UPI0027E044A2|nr:family 78 glycoside hydrolase catalytic domain [Dyadobacter sp. LHD-138]MDQ6477278.1 family 78 glycoside hydrolase catalytic domain [Dyadobacter sp. LHD-138]